MRSELMSDEHKNYNIIIALTNFEESAD